MLFGSLEESQDGPMQSWIGCCRGHFSILSIILTRMHSSRMRTARFSSRLSCTHARPSHYACPLAGRISLTCNLELLHWFKVVFCLKFGDFFMQSELFTPWYLFLLIKAHIFLVEISHKDVVLLVFVFFYWIMPILSLNGTERVQESTSTVLLLSSENRKDGERIT